MIRTECFYWAIVNEDTCEAIAHKFAIKKSSARSIVLSLGRGLCHPVWEAETPQRSLEDSQANFGSMRASKDIYLARLRRWMESRSLSDIPPEFAVPLPNVRLPIPVWTPTSETLLGTASNEQVALRLGISPMSVRSRRIELKINSFGGGGLDSFCVTH